MEGLKTVLMNALYLVLPLVFFAVIYLMTGFYYMDLNPNNWSESARLLIAIEGVPFMALGAIAAYTINSNSKNY